MIDKRTRGWWLAATLAVSAVLTAGCAPVDPDDLPGVYRDDETGGEIVLNADKTFAATDIPSDATGVGTAPADFSGTWEFTETDGSADFVYLTVDDGGLGTIGGIQLYPSGGDMEFHADPDGPPSLVLTRADGA